MQDMRFPYPAIYFKTGLSSDAWQSGRINLNATARQLLILIDGKRDVAELVRVMGEAPVQTHLPTLLRMGLVREIGHGARPTMPVVAPLAGAQPPSDPTSTGGGGRSRLTRVVLLLGVAALVMLGTWIATHARHAGNAAESTATPAVQTQAAKAAANTRQSVERVEILGERLTAPAPANNQATNSPPHESAPLLAADPVPAVTTNPRPALTTRLASVTGPAATVRLNRAPATLTPVPMPAPAAGLPPPGTAPTASNLPDLAVPRPVLAPGSTGGVAPAQDESGSANAVAPPRPTTTPPAAAVSATDTAPIRSQPPASTPQQAAAPTAVAAAGPRREPVLLDRPRMMSELGARARDADLGDAELVFRLTINEQGTVDKVNVIRARPGDLYSRAIRNAILQWRFDPQTSPGEKTFSIHFQP